MPQCHIVQPGDLAAQPFLVAVDLDPHLGQGGRDLLTAYVLGVEISTRVGVAAHGLMHAMGYHTTGIAGHFGCAVAAGKLFNLSPAKLALAQGLAVGFSFTSPAPPFYIAYNGAGRSCRDSNPAAARYGTLSLFHGGGIRRIKINMLGRARSCDPARDKSCDGPAAAP